MGEWKKTQCAMCVLSCGLEMEAGTAELLTSAEPRAARAPMATAAARGEPQSCTWRIRSGWTTP